MKKIYSETIINKIVCTTKRAKVFAGVNKVKGTTYIPQLEIIIGGINNVYCSGLQNRIYCNYVVKSLSIYYV